MVVLVRELLLKFLKPEAIPLGATELVKMDVRRRDLQLPDKWLFVGILLLYNERGSQEIGLLDEEVRAYQIDGDLIARVQTYIEEEARLDVDWWSVIISMKNHGDNRRISGVAKFLSGTGQKRSAVQALYV
ncbi:hypothetical protein ABVT39_004947 [Epinephelus coioides]